MTNLVEVLPNSSSIEVVQNTSKVEVDGETPMITTKPVSSKVNIDKYLVKVVTVGMQGLAGAGGGGGSARPPYRQYDSQPANNLYYKGWAEAADTSTATWMIVKGVETSHDVFLELWAEGNEDLDNIWDDRSSLIYS